VGGGVGRVVGTAVMPTEPAYALPSRSQLTLKNLQNTLSIFLKF